MLLLMALLLSPAAPSAPNVNQIVARSVANNQTDWKLAPQFTFTEHDLITKSGRQTDRTYRVHMIDGSPYNETVAVNGEPLSAAARAREQMKLRQETERRREEPASDRAARIARYERERRQDHELMNEMIDAFQFRLAGEENVDGRKCFRVEASPRPGYVPRSNETKVLKSMRGTLWIDEDDYQWVKVRAGVFKPVTFGLFIAHVQPGTEFILEEAPVAGNVWMPVHFITRVNAKILWMRHNSIDDETYSAYRRVAGTQ